MVVVVVVLGGSPARAAQLGTQGIPTDVAGTPAATDRALDLAARSGATLVRMEADWAALEPTGPGSRDPAALAALDHAVTGASARGLEVVLFVDRTPCWASSAPTRGDCTQDPQRSDVTRYQPTDPAAVVGLATELAARYAADLAAFQVWNEPDQANERYWAGPDKSKHYVQMLRALYGPLKAAAPGVPVLGGSFVGTNGTWLRAMYREGAKGFYDGLAVQFYTHTLKALRDTRAVQRAAGDRTPLWLTEFGYTPCYRPGGPTSQLDQACVSPAVASRGLIDVLTAVRTRPWIAATIQYDLFDEGPGGYTFGLATATGALKPAWYALQRVVTGKATRPQPPRARIRRVGDHLEVSGTSSPTELVTVRVTRGGEAIGKATLTTSPTGTWKVVLAPEAGTRSITARVSAGWTGAVTVRR